MLTPRIIPDLIPAKIDPRMFHDLWDMAPELDDLAAKGAKEGAKLAEKKMKKMASGFSQLFG